MLKGRIIKGVGGLYFVDTGNDIFKCNARGIFRKDKIKPAIGDFVSISVLDEVSEKTGIIEEISERRNMLVRPWVSNIDQAFVVFSIVSPVINLDLLDRIIVLAEEQGLEVVICLNKVDLCSEKELLEIKRIYTSAGYNVIGISTVTNAGINELKEALVGNTSVFAGPSGVGKSSIVNCLVPSALMEVGEISEKIRRGKHTTRHAELLRVDNNSYVVDSPGFSNVSFEHIKRYELKHYFKEFGNNDSCKFLDCLHLNEPECFVKKQVGTEILPIRYERYVRFLNDCGS
ncbi:MAG: ribosome small subunit-dependent GTPase A [Defluviitaleaceae bacterium]|nr:ribosome small subunit-dependent GTPase A [Defluviitaleaceae bacterium]